MKTIKHVFFDLDHTLWDFESNAVEALKELYQYYGLDKMGLSGFEYFYELYAEINNKMWEHYRNGAIDKHTLRTKRFEDTFRALGVPESSTPKDIWEQYLKITPEKTKLMPGAYSLLHTLKESGVKMHIITNGFSETQHRKLSASGINHFFNCVIISEETGYQKPQKEIFEHALNLAEASINESVYIGDHPEADVQGGLNAGLDVIFYNPGNFIHQMPVLADIRHLDEVIPILIPRIQS